MLGDEGREKDTSPRRLERKKVFAQQTPRVRLNTSFPLHSRALPPALLFPVGLRLPSVLILELTRACIIPRASLTLAQRKKPADYRRHRHRASDLSEA